MPLGNKPFENTVGKGEIAHNEQFLLFPQCFLPVWIAFCHFLSNLKMSSANSFSKEESKICRLVMGCAYRLDLATELTGQALHSGRVIHFIVYYQSLVWVTIYKILTKKDNFFVMLHIHV